MSQSVTGNERIVSLDVIRGFAILGIFLVNIPTMIGIEHPLNSRAYDGLDAIVRLLYDLFIQTKFYSIFAFLFGLGFYIFMSRAEARGNSINRLFTRRLVFLFIMGVAHAILLWTGDILNLYAIQGFWLLLFYGHKPKVILIWSLSLIACFTAIMYLSFTPSMSGTTAIVPIGMTHNTFVNYGEGVSSRIFFFLVYGISNLIVYLPEVLGLFLLGLYCGKINLFNRVSELYSRIKRIQLLAFLLTLLCSIPIFLYFVKFNLYDPKKVYFYIYLGGKTLAVLYVTSFLLLLRKEKWQKLLRPFSYVGRMALSNYLFQTVSTVLVLPLMIRNTAAYPLWISTLYCLIVFVIQVILSKWWLSKFSFGPMEWLWRIATYGKVQSMKRKSFSETTLRS